MRAPGDFLGFNWPVHENPCFLGKQHKSNTRQTQIITRQTQINTRQTPPFVSVHRPGTGSFFPRPGFADLLSTLQNLLSRPQAEPTSSGRERLPL